MFLLIGTVYGQVNGIFSGLLIIILCHAIANVLKASVVEKKIFFYINSLNLKTCNKQERQSICKHN